MQLVTLSGCRSQTSTVVKLLSAHTDGVIDSTQLSVCLMVLMSISSIRQILVPAT